MNADSPAATSGGSGRSSGCVGSLMRLGDSTSADVVVLCRALERFLRNVRTNRRVELRERAVEGAVIHVAAHAGAARGHAVARGRRRAEKIERMTLLAFHRV